MNFEETSKIDLKPEEMQEAMIQIQSDLKPSTKPDRKNKRYSVDPMTGQKTRILDPKQAQKNQSKSKSQRKSERAKRFFDNL